MFPWSVWCPPSDQVSVSIDRISKCALVPSRLNDFAKRSLGVLCAFFVRSLTLLQRSLDDLIWRIPGFEAGNEIVGSGVGKERRCPREL